MIFDSYSHFTRVSAGSFVALESEENLLCIIPLPAPAIFIIYKHSPQNYLFLKMKNEITWLTVGLAFTVCISLTLIFIPYGTLEHRPEFWYILFSFVFYLAILGILLILGIRTQWFQNPASLWYQWSTFWVSAFIIGILAMPPVLASTPPEKPHMGWLSALLAFLGHLFLIIFFGVYIYRICYQSVRNSLW